MVWTGKMSDGRESSAVDVSKITQMTSKPESAPCSGRNLGDIRLLPRWCPAYRQHEPGPGSRVEHVKARPETAGQHSNRLSADLREGELQAAESVRGRVPMPDAPADSPVVLSLIHISEPTRLGMISYAVFC